jgi:hypothetical protein
MLQYAAEAAAAAASEREAAGFVEVWEYQEPTRNWALVRIRTHTYAYAYAAAGPQSDHSAGAGGQVAECA